MARTFIVVTVLLVFSLAVSLPCRADEIPESREFDPVRMFNAGQHDVHGQALDFVLVLSGGGARGLAQIGVLRELERRDLHPSMIVGCSMGAVIGGLYAAGYSADSIAALAAGISWQDLLRNDAPRSDRLLAQKERGAGWFLSIPFRHLRPDWPSSISTGQNLSNFFWQLTLPATYKARGDFDKLPIPFRAVATDLGTGERVVLERGDLAQAIRASVAFPLAVAPITLDNRRLLDGGLVDPLPVDVARELGAKFVVAVNTSTALIDPDELGDPYELANQATSIMTQRLLERAISDADIRIEPDLDGLSSLDFEQRDELIERGRSAAEQQLAQLESSHRDLGAFPSTSSTKPAIPAIQRITLKGNASIPELGLLEAFDHREALHYSEPELMQAMEYVLAHYRTKGMTLAAFDDWSYDGASETLTLVIDEGVLAGIDLEGNTTVRNWVILRNVAVKPGEPFNAKNADRSLDDLYATGLFEQVIADIVPSAAGPRLHIAVTETSTDYLRLGLHHNLEYQTEAFAQVVRANLLGTGTEIALHAQYSPRRELFRAGLKSSRIFRTYLTAHVYGYVQQHEIRLYRDNQDIGYFETDEDGFHVSLGQHILRASRISAELERADIDLFVLTDSLMMKNELATIAALFRLDDRDREVLPRTGSDITVSLIWADEFLGGDIVYRALDAAATTHIPISSVWTTWLTARFASADRRLPLYRQFALGGRRSFYGLSDHELLGDKLFATSVGARWKAYSRSYLFGRVDVGTVWGHNDRIDFWRDLRLGFGGGLAFDTPLGPLEISGGLADSDASQFYFHWGYEF